MNDRFQELALFVRAAETGSFSRAAREFRLSQPSVSRVVAGLEARLGVRLLLRTTRQVTLSEAGAAFLPRARQLLADLEDAEDAARGAESLRGTLHAAMPATFGVREVIPHLPVFLARHPMLKIELIMSDRTQDLVAEGADVAIRLGPLADSGFGSRHLSSAPRLAVASPAYLERCPAPVRPVDLTNHACIFGPGASGREGWVFEQDGATLPVTVEARLVVASGEGMVACAKAGLGIALASLWMCRAELAVGALVPVLASYTLQPVSVHAVFPTGRRPSVKVRAFADHLAAALAGPVNAGADLTAIPPRR